MLLRTTRISFANSESYRAEEMPVKREPGKVHTGDRHYGILHPGDLAQFDATPGAHGREDRKQAESERKDSYEIHQDEVLIPC